MASDEKFTRKDPIFDGTKKSAIQLLRKVFPKLSRYSMENLSNTHVDGFWRNNKKSDILLIVPSVTVLQAIRLTYLFQIEPDDLILSPDALVSPSSTQYWWDVRITHPNSIEWKYKPQND